MLFCSRSVKRGLRTTVHPFRLHTAVDVVAAVPATTISIFEDSQEQVMCHVKMSLVQHVRLLRCCFF